MGALLTLIAVACSLVSLVCLILVLIQMFQNGQTGLGITCIVLLFVCGIGGLVTFVVGWMNAANWRIQQVMLIWSGAIAVGILVNLLSLALGHGVGFGRGM